MTTTDQSSQIEAILSTIAAQTEAINALTKALVLQAATVTKPERQIAAAPTPVQPSLLSSAKGIDEWMPIVKKWICRMPLGANFTHHQLCGWVENESGIVLSSADLDFNPGDKTPVWRRRVSRALRKLREYGILGKNQSIDSGVRSCSYVVVRLP